LLGGLLEGLMGIHLLRRRGDLWWGDDLGRVL